MIFKRSVRTMCTVIDLNPYKNVQERAYDQQSWYLVWRMHIMFDHKNSDRGLLVGGYIFK